MMIPIEVTPEMLKAIVKHLDRARWSYRLGAVSTGRPRNSGEFVAIAQDLDKNAQEAKNLIAFLAPILEEMKYYNLVD